MTGGILQLVATGADTVYLTGDPTITIFKCIYRRHTNFTITQSNCNVTNFTKFGTTGKYTIEKRGDCVSNMLMRIDIGDFNVSYLSPTNKNVINILKQYGITWSNTLDSKNIINLITYKLVIKPIVYDTISNRVKIYNDYFRILTDIQRGIDFYNENNDDTRLSIIRKINNLYNDTSFYENKNEIYALLDNLNINITPINYKETFDRTNNTIIVRNPDNTYSGSIRNNIIVLNQYYSTQLYYLSYQNSYNQYLYEHGYGLFVLDQSGNYKRDLNNNRIEKKYSLDVSYNYIYDSSGNKIIKNSNLSANTIKISGIFDVFKSYKKDVTSYNTFKTPIYIRDRMFDEYLNKIIDSGATPTSNQTNLKHVFTYFALLNEIIIPTVIGYLDKNIGDYYTDTFSKIYSNQSYPYLYTHNIPTDLLPPPGIYYNMYDSYKLLYKYLATLSDDNIYDDNSINLIKSTLITNMYDNLRDNYNLYNIITQIMRDSYFQNSNHFRFGIYNNYTTYIGGVYQADSRLFSIIQPSSLGLIDNFIDNINTILTSNIYFQSEINTYFNNFITNLGKTIESSVFSEYLNDQNLWSFLSFNSSKFKSLLQTIRYGNQGVNNSVVYTLLEGSLNQNVIDKMGIVNYLPIYLIDDIPRAINTNIANLGLTTNQMSELDLSSNIYDNIGYNLPLTDITFNKTKLYKRILENVVFSDDSGLSVADSDFINAYASSYLIDANKFSLFKVVRPENNYPFVINDKMYFIPNGRAVVEEYRREYYRIIKDGTNFTGGFAPSDAVKIKLFEMINLVLDQYIRFDFTNVFDSENLNDSSYISYTTQKYKFPTNLFYKDISGTPINSQTVKNNDTTKYIYGPASIYSAVIKDNTKFYNDFYNDLCLSKTYYETNLGLSMTNLYDKFDTDIRNIDISGEFLPYEYFTYNPVDNINIKMFTDTDLYPRIEMDYELSNLDPSQISTLKYYIYNQTGINSTIPVLNGYDFFDFQNIVNDASMNELVDGSGQLVETSTSLKTLLSEYDLSYNNLRYLLDIQNKYSNDLSFNTVSTTVDYYNNFFTVTDPDVITNIIEPTKTLLVIDYKLCGDLFYNNYDTGIESISNWSYKDILYNFAKSTNPFDELLQPNLFESYLYFTLSDRQLLLQFYLNITNNITNILYNDPYKLTLYNNFYSSDDLYQYFINYIISISDGSYLLRYTDATISIYNAEILKNINTNKTFYYNIITKILYYNGTLPINEEIEYINQRFSPYFPIRNLIPNAKIYESSELDIILSGMITGIKPSYSWVKELAYYMFEYFQLEINNDVFESQNSQLFSLNKKLFLSETHKRGIDYLIGNRTELYTYNRLNKSNITIYLPLNFWFTKNNTYNSLPMTNILYSDVSIAFKFKKLLDLLIIAPNSFIDKEPKVKCSFVIDYVYLEQEERLRIAASKLEFLVEKYNYGGLYSYKYKDIVNKTINTKLYFSDPTKFILWRVKVKNTDTLNWNKNGYEVTYQKVVNYYEPFTQTELVTYYPYTRQIPLIINTKINFNGNTRQEGDYNYFNAVIPYICGLGSLSDGECMYSFSLFPKLLQPSGAANLSVIEDLSFDHVLSNDIISKMETDNLEIEIEYWSLSYQVMRVMSGFIAPAFISQK
jgi:hypothetical protein